MERLSRKASARSVELIGGKALGHDDGVPVNRSRRDFIRTAGLGIAGLPVSGALETLFGRQGDRTRQDTGGLLIRGGRVVTEARQFDADIRVGDGTIREIGQGLEARVEEVIDARGLAVLPGGIDPHVHLTQGPGTPERFRFADDLRSGTAAAVAGGITTVGNMTVPSRDSGLFQAIERDAAEVEDRAIADVMLHPVLLDPTGFGEDEVARLVDLGHTSLKIFMVLESFDANVRDYLRVIRLAARAGLLPIIHAEDRAIVQEATDRAVASGRSGLEHYAESRPIAAEVAATRRAVEFARVAEAPIYLVHLSCRRALDICRAAADDGLPVYAETRPIYLHFTEERYRTEEGPLFVAQPPLRRDADVAAIWQGLTDGAIHTLGTDHVGWSRQQKMDPRLSVEDLRPGVPNLQEMLPVLHSEAVVRRGVPLERFVQLTAANPARLFGLYPRKGTIAVGSDADLALWDRRTPRAIEPGILESRAGFSLFDGWRVTGWPVITVRRGRVVYRDGQVTGRPGTGTLLERGPTAGI